MVTRSRPGRHFGTVATDPPAARFAALIPPEVTDPVRRASMINHLASALEIREIRKKRAEQEAACELAAAEARLAEILESTGSDAA
jgi:hypothetical protein